MKETLCSRMILQFCMKQTDAAATMAPVRPRPGNETQGTQVE